MKTIIKSFALLTTTLLLSLNMLATGFEFEPEQYIDDIPFDLEAIEKQIMFEEAMAADFCLPEEDYIDDIPFSEDYLTKLNIYTVAVAQEFNFEDEDFISDLPSFTTVEMELNTNSLFAKSYSSR